MACNQMSRVRPLILNNTTVKLLLNGHPLERALLLYRQFMCNLFLIIHVYLDSFRTSTNFAGTFDGRIRYPLKIVFTVVWFVA